MSTLIHLAILIPRFLRHHFQMLLFRGQFTMAPIKVRLEYQIAKGYS
jgi:hypothetical protein